ncbi:hypothetical protein DRH27_00210 [Candidatus Falkowbacteria bacterium]|nr:MAG: hypothetical protein DRH27_00210 [Candidatus Falkowbacteria bacterium]
MPEGGQKRNNIFEKPSKTSLKVKVKKLTGKKIVKRQKKRKIRKGKREEQKITRKTAKITKKAAPQKIEASGPEGRILEEKIERSKEMIMWSGVIFFMLLVAILWIYNIRHTFKVLQEKNDSESGISDWQEMTRELEEKISDFKDSYEEIKNIEEPGGEQGELPTSNEAEPASLFSTSTLEIDIATGTVMNTKVSAEEIEELKKKLEAEQ